MSFLKNKTFLNFPSGFWLLNFFQMLEKLAYWSVLLQLPVFIAQKDSAGGLHWEQTTKGIIFFWWALVQNISPIFTGSLSDKYGHKKTAVLSFILIIISYLILGNAKSFGIFLSGAVTLGLGSGAFKPVVQGSLSFQIKKESTSVGWGIYFMLLNLAVFFAPPLSKLLKDISWNMLFFGSAFISFINLLLILFSSRNTFISAENDKTSYSSIKNLYNHLKSPEIMLFLVIMSGFAIIYMQFYETLPNFIVDWSDTSSIAHSLPDFLVMNTDRGIMISYEWLYTINSLMIIFFIVLISSIAQKFRKISVLFLGVLLSAIGLLLCGLSISGNYLLIGMVVYTFGEMITNPKFTEYVSGFSGKNDKALTLGLMNISLAVGLGAGSLAGGYLYKNLAEKSSLALNYLNSKNFHFEGLNSTNSLRFLQNSINHVDANSITILLWNEYKPWIFWLPFVVIGIISAVSLVVYGKKYRGR